MKIALDPFAIKPSRAHDSDAGLDLMAPFAFVLEPRTSVTINTGVHVEIPENCAGFLKSKSGLMVNCGITSEGVIDHQYSGAIFCKLFNHGSKEYTFNKGDKITQLVILPVIIEPLEFVDEIKSEGRGDRGFGSSGK